jgi:hypothetical protein
MVEITNIEVYNLERAVVASGNAMRLEPAECTKEDFERGLERCKKLAKMGGGTGHSNFRTGILVTFDLKYPQYFTKQLQRYHFLQYVSSTSMMHRITKMDFDKCCNKYVSKSVKDIMDILVNYYNELQENFCKMEKWYDTAGEYMNYVCSIEDDVFYKFNNDIHVDRANMLYDCYMRIISNCPMGAELTVHVSTNYEQLATIYKQRKNHKLKEDWGEFCRWIESLPYAKELIIGEE